MRWGTKIDSVGLPVGIRRRASVRPSLVARAARAVDRGITCVQERLEGTDRVREKILTYMLLALFWVILGCAVVRWII